VVVYLSGEIHTDWREQIVAGIDKEKLPVDVLAPVTDHPASDDIGVSILGEEDKPLEGPQGWQDQRHPDEDDDREGRRGGGAIR